MPTELEEELLAMAAAERARTQQPAQAADELPELEPDILLSASARAEVRAAQRQRGQRDTSYMFNLPGHGAPSRELIEETLGVTLSAETPEQVPVELHTTVELSGRDADWVREEIERDHNPSVSMGTRVAMTEPNANQDVFSADALASLFMTREAHSQAELAGISELVAEEAGIDFNADMGSIHLDSSRSTRFGGYGPVGGQVVSQRGEDGQWTSTVGRRSGMTDTRPMGSREAVEASVSPRPTYPTTRMSQGVPSPSQPPQAPVDRSSILTAIERVAGRGPLDD